MNATKEQCSIASCLPGQLRATVLIISLGRHGTEPVIGLMNTQLSAKVEYSLV